MTKEDAERDNIVFEKGGYWVLPWCFNYKGVPYYREYLFYEVSEYEPEEERSSSSTSEIISF